MSVFRSSSFFLTSSCVHKQQLKLKPKPNPSRLRTGQQVEVLSDPFVCVQKHLTQIVLDPAVEIFMGVLQLQKCN